MMGVLIFNNMVIEVTLRTENNVSLDDVLKKYNMTEEQFKAIVKETWETAMGMMTPMGSENGDKAEVTNVRILKE